MLCLGLDSGTTTCKGLVLEVNSGKALAQASAPHSFIGGLPRGHVEQDPQTWCDAAERVIQSCLEKIGERIWNMERDFNNKAGFSAKDDTLPKRLLTEPAKSGPAKGLVNKLPEMLPQYYEIRGWDAEGRLKPETRERLGL